MKLTINAIEQHLTLSYDEVVSRAGKKPETRPIVIWKSQDHRFSGLLTPGDYVEITDNMVFSVSDETRIDPNEVTEPDGEVFAAEEPPTKDESPRVKP